MTVRVHEQTVHGGSDSKIRVVGGRADEITVHWTCGAERVFTPDALRELVGQIDVVSGLDMDDVWVSLTDRRGYGFAVQVLDGELYAADKAGEAAGSHVPWASVRRAISRALRQADKMGKELAAR